MKLICVKFHTNPKKKLHTYWFTDKEKARSFINSLKWSVNVLDYRVSETDANIADEYRYNLRDAPVRQKCSLDKRDFLADATKRETEDGLVYEGFLGHPEFGRKKVLTIHKETMEMMGIADEKGIVCMIYDEMDYYLTVFMYDGECALPIWVGWEEQNGYEVKWPPMAE